MAEHGPTERGLEALAWLLCQWDGKLARADWDVNAGGCRVYYTEQARQAAAALHDPSLGLDRSMPLRAVYRLLEESTLPVPLREHIEAMLDAEFGGQG